MQTVQRQFGKLTTRGNGNDAKVSVLLKDYEEADKMLAKIIDASKAWRDAWVSILSVQLSIVKEFEELYNPIVGAANDSHGHVPAITPQGQLERSAHLKEVYTELKSDLMEEVNMMDARIIKPATEAREYIQPLKKTIKKRENKRLDYERYQDRVNNAAKKVKRSEREDAALARAEMDLSKAADDFKVADAHLRETLPPIVAAAFAILPHLLAAQIMTQNTLLAQYYTVLHNYSQEEGFPSPPPPMEDVISQWTADFKPIQRQVESITTIARGKTVHTSMQFGDDTSGSKSMTGLNIRNNMTFRRKSSQGTTVPGATSPSRVNGRARIPSTSSNPSLVSAPEYDEPGLEAEPEPEVRPSHLSPDTAYVSHSPAGPSRDYFTRDRQQSDSIISNGRLSPGASIIGKKKPPPPPPKRIQSAPIVQYVTAMYGFEGQEHGDLSFKKGDRIKVLKKTRDVNDWWDGELNGQKGRFPANYCE